MDAYAARVEDLVLTRLLAGGPTGETRTKIAADLEPIVQHRHIGAEWGGTLGAALETLERQGRVTAGKGGKRYAITDAGRAQALAFLRIDDLPAKTNWSTLKNVYLFARAMGVPADSRDAVKKLSSVTGVRAVILRQAHHLPTDPVPTQTQALDALLWKQIGRDTDEPFSTNAVKAYLLGQVLGSQPKMTVAQLMSAVTAKAVEARRADRASLCQAALKRLLPEKDMEPSPAPDPVPTPPAAAPVEADPAAFARQVLDAGRASPTGWFGDPGIAAKVFISHVYRSYVSRHPEGAPSLEEFKQRLVDLHRQGLLSLSRADLVEAMDAADVRASETRYLNAEFHFLRVRD